MYIYIYVHINIYIAKGVVLPARGDYTLRNVSHRGSQISEPLSMFDSKYPVKVQMSQGLGPFVHVELLTTGRTSCITSHVTQRAHLSQCCTQSYTKVTSATGHFCAYPTYAYERSSCKGQAGGQSMTNIWQHVATCGKMSQHVRSKKTNYCKLYVICGPAAKTPFVPTPSGSRWQAVETNGVFTAGPQIPYTCNISFQVRTWVVA